MGPTNVRQYDVQKITAGGLVVHEAGKLRCCAQLADAAQMLGRCRMCGSSEGWDWVGARP